MEPLELILRELKENYGKTTVIRVETLTRIIERSLTKSGNEPKYISDARRQKLKEQAYNIFKGSYLEYVSKPVTTKGKHNTPGLKAMCEWLKNKGVFAKTTANCDVVYSIYKQHKKELDALRPPKEVKKEPIKNG